MTETKDEKIYHLIPMNMDNYNIDDIILSLDKNGYVEWNNGTIEGKYAQEFKENDIVYIYCTNLPDGSKRILFRAVVEKVNNAENKQKTFNISNITPIKMKQKSKIRKEYDFSYETLKEKYKIKMNQSMRCLMKKGNEHYEEEEKLINELEKLYNKEYKDKTIDKETQIKIMEEVKDYFNNEVWCECCEILIKKGDLSKTEANNRTFIKNDGLRFYEIHHLLMQNILRKDYNKNRKWFNDNKWYHSNNDKDKQMILDDYNCIILCPVCHMELHHGDNEKYKEKYGVTKEQVINELMKEHQYDQRLKEEYKKSPEEIRKIKNYILQQYITLTNKSVFEDTINIILKRSHGVLPKQLKEMLKDYDPEEKLACYNTGNYVRINKEKIVDKEITTDQILDLNVNRERRIEKLNKLNDILKND